MAEERNLTRAARKAFISQPTLTNYINRLEEQLGVKLFDRSVTPIEITRAGALYIEQMKKIQLARPTSAMSCAFWAVWKRYSIWESAAHPGQPLAAPAAAGILPPPSGDGHPAP